MTNTKSNTPETDAFVIKYCDSKPPNEISWADFACNLERERDEKDKALGIWIKRAADAACECNQLRKVCDGLAKYKPEHVWWCKSTKITGDTCDCGLDNALDAYSQLPHVKAKGNKV